MNTLSLMMYLLSQKGNLYQIGATEDEIANILNLKGKIRRSYFYDLLINLSNYIAPLGLVVKFNPLDSHWFISHNRSINELTKSTPYELTPRLAATLISILALCLKSVGITNITDVKKLRKKKDISKDLNELETMGYIIINKSDQKIKLTPLIGYHINISDFYTQLSQRKKA